MDINNSMVRILLDRLTAPAKMPGRLREVAESALVEVEGAVLVDNLYLSGMPPSPTSQDLTGYECFVNHFHLDDYTRGDQFGLGLLVMKRILERFNAQFPDRVLRSIIAFNGDEFSVRFHVVRQGESWLTENLNDYQNDAILVIDSSDLGMPI